MKIHGFLLLLTITFPVSLIIFPLVTHAAESAVLQTQQQMILKIGEKNQRTGSGYIVRDLTFNPLLKLTSSTGKILYRQEARLKLEINREKMAQRLDKGKEEAPVNISYIIMLFIGEIQKPNILKKAENQRPHDFLRSIEAVRHFRDVDLSKVSNSIEDLATLYHRQISGLSHSQSK